MEHFITLIKKRLWYNWSQLRQLWTSQLLSWIKGKWKKDVIFHFPCKLWSTAATLPILFCKQENMHLQEKRKYKG
jgi:hypothetical protein